MKDRNNKSIELRSDLIGGWLEKVANSKELQKTQRKAQIFKNALSLFFNSIEIVVKFVKQNANWNILLEDESL